MCLYPGWWDTGYISLSLTRCSSSKQEVHELVLDCELSIIDEYGEDTFVSKQITNHGFVENHTWSPCKDFVSRKDVFTERRNDFIPYNVLHVRCQIWRSFNEKTLSELIATHTKIESSHFIWKIDNFSRLKDHEVKKMHVKKPFSGIPILSYRFYADEMNDEAIVELKSNNGFKLIIWCEVVALNSTGESFDSEYNTFTLHDECLYERCLTLTLSDLLNNKTLYLPMDALSLRIDSFYWSSDFVNVSPVTLPNMQICENAPSTKCDVNPDTRQNLERFAQDMHGMYKEGLLSDFTLCAGTRTFPVHKNMLSARSPVFKAMFTTPLKEKDGKTLNIPDIDADTLHRMLLFVYSSEIADLEWEDAISLYFAADKYNIEDLKSITSSVLKAKLSVSNVCEILVHADLHEDQDLKCSAMEFIANYDDEILGNENWKMFQKKHMPLAMEVLSALYATLKKRLE